MKYLTSVIDEKIGTKHIIETTAGNDEVIQIKDKYEYGNKKGEYYFISGRIKVFYDLTFLFDEYDSMHFAEIIAAIEKVRFVIEEIKKPLS